MELEPQHDVYLAPTALALSLRGRRFLDFSGFQYTTEFELANKCCDKRRKGVFAAHTKKNTNKIGSQIFFN
jgi:hypothetical protein